MTVIWRGMKIVNLAHGAFVLLGAYITYGLSRVGLNPLLSIPVSVVVLFLAGWLVGGLVKTSAALLATFGLGLVLIDLSLNLFGPDSRSLGVVDSQLNRVVTLLVALALTGVMLRVRARSVGLPIGAATAGAAGSLVALNYSFTPAAGLFYTPIAFAVCALGGVGSIAGALLGGLLFGAVQSLSQACLGPAFQSVVAFAVLVLALIVRRKAAA